MPRYAYDRLTVWLYEKLHPDSLWLTSAANKILESWLRPSDVGFEWGAGRNTLWLAKRVANLTSIEHDAQYYERIRLSLSVAQIKNVHLQLQSLDGEENSAYIKAINSYTPNSLDFVLVDGRLRHYCVIAAVDKVRPGGLLILDNANRYLPNSSRAPGSLRDEIRPEWLAAAAQLKEWRCIWTSNGVFDTSLFVKSSLEATP